MIRYKMDRRYTVCDWCSSSRSEHPIKFLIVFSMLKFCLVLFLFVSSNAYSALIQSELNSQSKALDACNNSRINLGWTDWECQHEPRYHFYQLYNRY